ncbi:MAG: hypothetical protein JWP82_889 [Humibacillus sp.]|nr:hypothetical protein [Humibacillus sp.]
MTGDPTTPMTTPTTPASAPHPHPSTTELPMTQQPDPLAQQTPVHPYRVEPAVPVPDDLRVEDPSPAPAPRAPVQVRRGPRPGSVVLGLLCMLVAGYVVAANTSATHLELRVVGPVLVAALGGLLLLVGLVGVVVGRLRR